MCVHVPNNYLTTPKTTSTSYPCDLSDTVQYHDFFSFSYLLMRKMVRLPQFGDLSSFFIKLFIYQIFWKVIVLFPETHKYPTRYNACGSGVSKDSYNCSISDFDIWRIPSTLPSLSKTLTNRGYISVVQ